MPTPIAELRASLEKHNAEFESLLRLIPAKYYLVDDEPAEQVRQNTAKEKSFVWTFYAEYTPPFRTVLKVPKEQKEPKGA